MKIAFVDHHLNNYHADKFLGLLRGPLAGENVEISSAWESNPTGADWCEKNKVKRADSLESAVRDAEGIMVLAPDNVETHLALAKKVLPAGKPTLIDKFLAPTLADARAIAALSKRFKTPIFSSSSLRFAEELETALKVIGPAEPVTELYARGMGAWSGYGIHTLAMALRIMGHGVRRVIDTGTKKARTVTLDYGSDRRAVLDVRTAANEWQEFNWRFAARTGDHYVSADIKDYDGFYSNLMRRASAFFRSGHSEVSVEEALVAVSVLESADRSLAHDGTWVSLSN